MSQNDMGRLNTRAPTSTIKVKLDEDTAKKLSETSEMLEIPKAAVIRRGIHLVHEAVQDEIDEEKE